MNIDAQVLLESGLISMMPFVVGGVFSGGLKTYPDQHARWFRAALSRISVRLLTPIWPGHPPYIGRQLRSGRCAAGSIAALSGSGPHGCRFFLDARNHEGSAVSAKQILFEEARARSFWRCVASPKPVVARVTAEIGPRVVYEGRDLREASMTTWGVRVAARSTRWSSGEGGDPESGSRPIYIYIGQKRSP
jgi:hypothetical protein